MAVCPGVDIFLLFRHTIFRGPPLLYVSGLVCLLGGVLAYSSYQAHTLNILLSLEAIMLRLLVVLYSFNCLRGSPTQSFLILLTFAACEAALGLSLLVSMLRL